MSLVTASIAGGLVAVAAGGIAYVALMPLLSHERRADARLKAMASGSAKNAVDRAAGVNRREQVARSLKEIEAKADKTKITLELRLARAGLDWSRNKFFVVAALIAVFAAVVVTVLTGSVLFGLAGLFAGGAGLPIWLLSFLEKRRIKRFVAELPNAIDVVVRGIRTGIPVNDCLKMVAREAEEPLRSEFRIAMEAQTIGLPLGEAILRMYERVPVSEVNFFAVVIAIQQKSGGNLSEALGNLSRVLRERKKMYSKVQAMSMEAKASGWILSSMPFAVAIMTYISSPNYISLLWTTSAGKMALAASGAWMLCGILAMKKMINFEV